MAQSLSETAAKQHAVSHTPLQGSAESRQTSVKPDVQLEPDGGKWIQGEPKRIAASAFMRWAGFGVSFPEVERTKSLWDSLHIDERSKWEIETSRLQVESAAQVDQWRLTGSFWMASWFQHATDKPTFEIIPKRTDDADEAEISIAKLEDFIDEMVRKCVHEYELNERVVSREAWSFKMQIRLNYREGPCVTKMQFKDIIAILVQRISKPVDVPRGCMS